MIIKRFLCAAILSVAAVLLLAGCASTGGGGLTQEEIQKEVKGLTATTFVQPISRVHDAAIRALTSVGCDVDEKQNYKISGSRPRHMGLIVGSGGETVTVFMLPQGDKSTQVWVDTDRTFLGLAGQRNWDERTLNEMKNILSVPAPAPAR
jgi:hypothetical protein